MSQNNGKCMSSFLMSKSMSSNVFVCLTKNPVFEDIKFKAIDNREKQQIFTFEKSREYFVFLLEKLNC